MKLSTTLLGVAQCATLATALTAAEWRNQSIYQVLTDRFSRPTSLNTDDDDCNISYYCGGTWQGIIDKLDYIQGMGFTAIWISPVVENMPDDTAEGSAYAGYWAQDIYSLNSHFGTASDLKALSDKLHENGMHLMVDVVTNHMAYKGCETCVNYSVFNPFNEKSYYHEPNCTVDYNDPSTYDDCWGGDEVVSLPDLRTENSTVASMWNSWVKEFVKNYTIDGLRIDSAQYVNKGFYPDFQKAAGVHVLGEVSNGSPGFVCPYQNYMSGVLNYPTYYWITRAFNQTGGDIAGLVSGISWMRGACYDVTVLGSFMENHDHPRFGNLTQDVSLTKNAIAFTMLMDGIPIIYYGQEQQFSGGDIPYDREPFWPSQYDTDSTLYKFIGVINAIRSHAIYIDSDYVTSNATITQYDPSTVIVRKGIKGSQLVSVLNNLGDSGSSHSVTLSSSKTDFTAGESVTDVVSCDQYVVGSDGSLAFSLKSGLPRIFIGSASLSGNSLCPTYAITFDEKVTTTNGQTIKIVGSVDALGSWDADNAVTLSASSYTNSNPLWSVSIYLPPGEVIEYKFINVASDGTPTWEADPNHTYTVPTAAATVSTSWQS